jgi:cell volume regulation protein A
MSFALAVLLATAAALAGVLSNRLTERIKVPAPALILVAAAIVVEAIPDLHAPPASTVERLVTIALLCILFDGGMHIGWPRLRTALAPIAVVGVAGTFVTVAGGAVALRLITGLDWFSCVLVATAVAPTDPAVVFSVLGTREVSGRSGTILEGESGANDPVGIALMASLISAGSLSAGALGHVAAQFAEQMGIGLVVGVVGGRVLLWFMRRIPLPSEGLYPLRTLICALALYAIATLAHGSGFLAVFVAGILIGHERAPYKREIEHFHAALASLGEIVAFAVLGLTVDLDELGHADVLVPGLLLGLLLAVVIRPLLVRACLIGSGLARNERAFVLLAGLKGAVPILLGTLILGTAVPDPGRLYGIVVIVVVFSVVVQGSLVPLVADLLRVPMRTVEPEPWALGVRLRDEPAGVLRLRVAAGSVADGRRVEDLDELPGDAWISFLVRDGRLVTVTRATELRAADEALILADPELEQRLRRIFDEIVSAPT